MYKSSEKAGSTTKASYVCNSFSIKEVGKALGSGTSVNTSFSITQTGKKPA